MILINVLILLVLAIGITSVTQRLRLSPIVGYLITGMFLGPSGVSLISHDLAIKTFAEMGVVFLLFTVGLEFSLAQLMAMRNIVFLGGGLQVLITISVVTLVGVLFPLTTMQAIVLGCIVAMSSTSIVLKQLTEQTELNTEYGRHAVGFLLFQDLAAIPMLILVPMLATVQANEVLTVLSMSLVKGLLAIALIFGVGRWLFRPLFRAISKFKSAELFTLIVLLITLGCAALTHVLNLSYVLGAFVAGMLIGETEYRHQVAADIRPFRDVLLALFFISIGMLFDHHALLLYWPWVLLLFSALVLFKAGVITLVCRYLTGNFAVGLRTGLILGQGSEFGFAVLTLALGSRLFDEAYGQVILAGLLLSILVSPILIRFNERIANQFAPHALTRSKRQVRHEVRQISQGLDQHVVICGYGRVGQNVAHVLKLAKQKFVAIDFDPTLVQTAKTAGEPVTWGNIAQPEILRAAGIHRARALVISFVDTHLTERLLEDLQRKYPQLPIVVRAHDEFKFEQYHQHDLIQVIPETLETSLVIAAHCLTLLEASPLKTSQILQRMRANHYQLSRELFFGGERILNIEADDQHEQLAPVVLPENAYAVGKSLVDLTSASSDLQIKSVHRQGADEIKMTDTMQFQSGDVVILFGTFPQIERSENLLLHGK